MKLVTKIATIATLASFMFAGMNINWGNTYADDGAGAMIRLRTPELPQFLQR